MFLSRPYLNVTRQDTRTEFLRQLNCMHRYQTLHCIIYVIRHQTNDPLTRHETHLQVWVTSLTLPEVVIKMSLNYCHCRGPHLRGEQHMDMTSFPQIKIPQVLHPKNPYFRKWRHVIMFIPERWLSNGDDLVTFQWSLPSKASETTWLVGVCQVRSRWIIVCGWLTDT